MKPPFLFKEQVLDDFVKENFKRIYNYLVGEPILRFEFGLLEINVTAPATEAAYPHALGFTPKDAIIVHNLNNQPFTLHYSKFDKTNIYFSCPASTVVRLLIGRYQ